MSRRKDGSPGGDYEVGYGRPPKASRFAPGRSGNPGGRPRKPLSDDEILRKELDRKVEIEENGERRKLSFRHVIVRKLVVAAARGDLKATATIRLWLSRTPETAPELASADLAVEDQAILEAHEQMLREQWAAEAKQNAANTPSEDPDSKGDPDGHDEP